MRSVTIGIAAAVLTLMLVGMAAAGYFWAGQYNVAATEPHVELVGRFLDRVRTNSVRRNAVGIAVPPLDDPAQLETGVSHFHQMCVSCHGAPGTEPSGMAEGLYPKPPDLAVSVRELSQAETFWIIKNGIKMSGMPAYGPTHDDWGLWGIVAFLRRLPDLSAQEYQEMVRATGLSTDHLSGHGGGHPHALPSGATHRSPCEMNRSTSLPRPRGVPPIRPTPTGPAVTAELPQAQRSSRLSIDPKPGRRSPLRSDSAPALGPVRTDHPPH